MSGVGWVDLTVREAEPLRDFYSDVVGWRPEPVSMGEYSDFNMVDPTSGVPVAGVCHARGVNADLPPVWMVYFAVPDLDASLIMDALQKRIYKNDRQIKEEHFYHHLDKTSPRAVVTVEELGE